MKYYTSTCKCQAKPTLSICNQIYIQFYQNKIYTDQNLLSEQELTKWQLNDIMTNILQPLENKEAVHLALYFRDYNQTNPTKQKGLWTVCFGLISEALKACSRVGECSCCTIWPFDEISAVSSDHEGLSLFVVLETATGRRRRWWGRVVGLSGFCLPALLAAASSAADTDADAAEKDQCHKSWCACY